MAIRKTKILKNNTRNIVNQNQSNERSFSHFSEPENGSFILQSIKIEDIDKCVIDQFDNFFQVDGKNIRLINGMADESTIPMLYPELYQEVKKTLIKPYLTVARTAENPIIRFKNSYKPTVYVVPTMKPQGLVFEEYITKTPNYIDLTYSFIFLTSYKENLNEFIFQLIEFFRTKRNIIHFNNERFSIRPATDLESLFDAEETQDVDSPKEYFLEFELVVEAYLRDETFTQKRERPNSYSIEYTVKHGRDGGRTNISRQVIKFKE